MTPYVKGLKAIYKKINWLKNIEKKIYNAFKWTKKLSFQTSEVISPICL